MLALLVGLGVLFGVVRPGRITPWRMNWSGAFWLALPGVLLFGGDLLGNWLYFGEAMPLSGEVKLYLEREWGWWRCGSPFQNLRWHAHFLCDTVMWPLAGRKDHTMWLTLGIFWPADLIRRTIQAMVAVGLAYGTVRACWRQADAAADAYALRVLSRCPRGLRHRPFQHDGALPLAFHRLHDLVLRHRNHALLVSRGLGIVWFAELLSAAIERLSPIGFSDRFAPSLGTSSATVAFMIAISTWPIYSLCIIDPNTTIYLQGAKWFNAHLPAGQKLSGCSAGIMAYFANAHQTVNLDGLINDRDYFDNYLKKGKLDEYVRSRGIGYFADCSDTNGWRGGNYWGLQLKHMRLLQWIPISDSHSYAIWRFLPLDQCAEVLDPCDGPHNRVAQVQYAAVIQGQFDVVENDRLAAALKEATLDGKQLVTSVIVPYPLVTLQHVFVPQDQVHNLGLTPTNCLYETPENVVFGDSIELLGMDLPNRKFSGNQPIVISRYWALAHGENRVAEGDCTVELTLERTGVADPASASQEPQLLHSTRTCSGPSPFPSGATGEAVVDTYVIPRPADQDPGSYALKMTVKDSSGRPLAPSRNGDQRLACFLTNIEIRRVAAGFRRATARTTFRRCPLPSRVPQE